MSQPHPRGETSGALLHDEALGRAEEGDDLLHFGAVRYLLFDLQDSVVEADLTIEDQAVSHREMALCALVDTRLGEHARMDPSVDGRVILDGDEGRYVFAEAAACGVVLLVCLLMKSAPQMGAVERDFPPLRHRQKGGGKWGG